MGTQTLEIPQRGGRPARRAQVSLRSIQREGYDGRLKAFEQERFKFGGGPAKLSKEVKVPSKLTTVALDGVIRELIEIKSQVGLYPENEVSFVIDKG